MALEKTVAAVANLKSAAATMLTHCQDHSTEIAQLKQAAADVDAADASVAADIQTVADELNAASNPPA